MTPVEKKGIDRRITVVGIVFLLCFLTIGARAVYLQAYCRDALSLRAAEQYQRTLTVRGKRGTIYDSHRREMAVSIDTTSIAAYPRKITAVEETVAALSRTLHLPPQKLRRKLSSRHFVWIKRQVTPREERAVRELDMKGIDFIPEHSRFYPNRSLAAQLLGFTGIDGQGLEGLEYSYEDELKPRKRKLTVLTDALGASFDAAAGQTPGVGGQSIVLTIDRTIQYITEKALEEVARRFSAQSGMAVVMDPATGAVLGMANYPFFNPNAFGRFPRPTWRNRVVTDPLEPGSTMKIFSAAAAIESAGCTPNTIFFCENGEYRIGRDIVHDTHKHGWLSIQKIIKYSSNIGAVKMGEMIGAAKLHTTLSRFGFGGKTGIDCPAETTGILLPYERWTKIDAGAIAFGHGISVSPIQLITAVSAIANKGILMKPYVVQAVVDRNGKVVRKNEPQAVRQAVSPKTADTVRWMMQTVVEEGGTGVQAAPDGYSAGGKTGTAKKLNKDGEYARRSYTASFVGFAPAQNPRVAILVIVDEPQNGYYGGVVAAPAFRRIAEETLNYLNVPPQRKPEPVAVTWRKD